MLRTIRSRLVLLSVAWLAPVLAIVAAGTWGAWALRVNEARAAMTELARATAASFGAWVDGVLDESAAVGGAIAAEPRTSARVLAAAAERHPSRVYAWTSPDGRVLAASDPALVGVDVAGREEVARVRAGAPWAVGNLGSGLADDGPAFAAATAVRDASGGLVGIVVAVLQADQIDVRALGALQLESAAVSVFDANGRLVFRAPSPGVRGWSARNATRQGIVGRALAGDEATGTVRSEVIGDLRTASAVPIRALGWVARAGRPQSVVLGPIRRDLAIEAGVLLLVGALGLAASALVGRWIDAPLAALERRAAAWRRGARPEGRIRGPAEVEALGAVFDEMASALVQQAADEARAREALRESEERFRRAIVAAPYPIMLREAGGRVVLVNEAWSRTTGYAPEDLPTVARWAQLAHGARHDEMLRMIAESIAEGRGREGIELPVRTRDGRERIWRFAWSPLGDVGGVPLVATVAIDVSEQRAAEAALRDADRRKDEFLAVLSHELRNPLAPIRNSLEILHRAPAGSDPARRAQGVLERQVAQVTRLVDDLLDVTRIARGKLQVRHEPVDLAEVARRVAEDHRTVLARHGVAFDVSVADGPLPLLGDAVRVGQVIGNLLQNAAKFTPAGGRVALDVARDGAGAVIRVRDTGIGIPAELRERIFDAFAQGPQGVERGHGGLGLGLALAKGLVAHHGGTIEARSDGPGRGAELVVRLPLADAVLEPAPAREAPAPAAPCRILVVDDNVDGAQSLRELLELDGHEVEVAHEGHDAIERAKAFRPNVLFCDIGLPGLDGYEVAQALRDDPALRGAYFVALTGYAQAEDRERSRAAGFDEHLAKPTSVDALRGAVAAGPCPA